jgi:signal transduction histidine kinase
VDNLLSNSVNHSPTGGTITVRVAEREEGVEISVADEGPGIPEAYRERVFEKYAQLDLRRSGLSTNRGLGLTFCRLAVEAHGGTLWAEEAEGGGALFRVLLPAAEAAQPARPVEVGAST